MISLSFAIAEPTGIFILSFLRYHKHEQEIV